MRICGPGTSVLKYADMDGLGLIGVEDERGTVYFSGCIRIPPDKTQFGGDFSVGSIADKQLWLEHRAQREIQRRVGNGEGEHRSTLCPNGGSNEITAFN